MFIVKIFCEVLSGFYFRSNKGKALSVSAAMLAAKNDASALNFITVIICIVLV